MKLWAWLPIMFCTAFLALKALVYKDFIKIKSNISQTYARMFFFNARINNDIHLKIERRALLREVANKNRLVSGLRPTCFY